MGADAGRGAVLVARLRRQGAEAGAEVIGRWLCRRGWHRWRVATDLLPVLILPTLLDPLPVRCRRCGVEAMRESSLI